MTSVVGLGGTETFAALGLLLSEHFVLFSGWVTTSWAMSLLIPLLSCLLVLVMLVAGHFRNNRLRETAHVVPSSRAPEIDLRSAPAISSTFIDLRSGDGSEIWLS